MVNKYAIFAIFAISLLLISSLASATVDTVGDTSDNTSPIGNDNIYYQQITASADGVLSSVGFNIYANPSSANIVIGIYNSTKNLLALSSATAATTGWNDLNMTTSVNIASGQNYFVALSASAGLTPYDKYPADVSARYTSYAYDGSLSATLAQNNQWTGGAAVTMYSRIIYYETTSTTSTSSTSSTTTTEETTTSEVTTTTEATTTMLYPLANNTEGCCPFDLTGMLTKSCAENNTEVGYLVYNNRSYETRRVCTYGCDDISGCKPAPFFTDMYALGFIILLIIVFAFIMWVIRKI